MTKSASRAVRRAKTSLPAPPEPATDGEILWKSGTGRVLRRGDVVKVDGLRGRYRIANRQPWPEAIALWGQPRVGASPRYVRPERVHVRRAATAALKEG